MGAEGILEGQVGEIDQLESGSAKGWRDAILAVTVLLVPATIGLVLFAIPSTREGIGMAMLTAAASFGVGSFFGFIFGIPRMLASPGNEAEKVADNGRRHVAPNTNLEQISDWLTKILVGVGLVELGQISTGVGNLAEGLAPSLGGGTTGYPVAVTLMISFTIIGFIGSYLFTRLRLEGAFSLENFIATKVEPLTDLVAEKVEQVEQVKKDLDASSVADARAQALVESQLDPRHGGESVEELTEVLKAATPTARVNAFYLAREQRRSNWRGGKKELVERTIPVFEALVACDEEGRYHRNHGELGYALKDKENPDYDRAIVELDKAIAMRAPTHQLRFWRYEFNRAWCRIKLQEASGDLKSSDEVIAAVCADLAVAVNAAIGRNVISGDDAIDRWIEANHEDPQVQQLSASLGK